jgi:hypothetical protein
MDPQASSATSIKLLGTKALSKVPVSLSFVVDSEDCLTQQADLQSLPRLLLLLLPFAKTQAAGGNVPPRKVEFQKKLPSPAPRPASSEANIVPGTKKGPEEDLIRPVISRMKVKICS